MLDSFLTFELLFLLKFACAPIRYLTGMILSNNLISKTHYEIIGVDEDAGQEEIRKNYRAAILNHHPDKLHKSEHESNNQFLKVQRAWEVLGDPVSRALYDNELRKSRLDADDVSFDEMAVEDFGGYFELSYYCRCGDLFLIDSSELAEMGYPLTSNGGEISLYPANSSLPASVVLPCGSCSLKIRLLIDADVKLKVMAKLS
ncbi:DNAJ heat shock N-terminal domain-containing protein [Striga asiatica]|uniref:DNAJ heat shock N-terminal domain-containing protein n=1 Tax=Striga asiatica TaxID=4170 RepID=A0A5A7PUX1_STRAF|nr:DNAJ heat shock N-terminal domain-containing protein [Striga asiatica]